MEHHDPTLETLIDREVVVDMASTYVFLGKLTGYDQNYLILEDADAHDLRDTNTTRENYVVDSRRLGIRANREKVYVRVGDVVCVSALDDIMV